MYYEDFLSRFIELPIAYYVSRRGKEDMDSSVWFHRHLHREFEVLLLRSGDGVVTVNKTPIKLKSGDVILIPPFVLHEAEANYDTTLEEYCICFDLSILRACDPMFARMKIDDPSLCGVLTADDPITQAVTEHLLQIIKSCQEHPIGWTAEVRGHLLLMFSLFLHRFNELGVLQPDQSDDFYRRVVEYVSENYQGPITSRTASDRLNYSQSYFCRRFKRDFGVCFNEYLNNYRLYQARNLLIKEKHTVAEVAARVGFSSPGYFSHRFQQQFGMLPSEYSE